MTVFVDTSAFCATLDSADRKNQAAMQVWHELEDLGEPLLTSNYVVVETVALLGRRLGFSAAKDFQTQLVPLVRVVWIDQSLHDLGMAAFLSAGQRHLSLVDCVSFELMRKLGLATAFTLDIHFANQGFRCVP